MEKWILLGLLEAATVMAVASLWLLWRAYKLRKSPPSKDESDTEQAEATQSMTAAETQAAPATDDDNPYRAFALELEAQANQAADHLKSLRDSDDLESVTQYKIWGTLAKAERAIILNNSTEQPQAILNRFMASIIHTLDNIQNKQIDKSKLQSSIADLDQEFMQASELIISKETLIDNQKELHAELQASIEFASQKVKRMGIKDTELQRLTVELKKLQEQVKEMESHSDHSHQILAPDNHDNNDASPSSQHHSSHHLKQLERMSQRQQAIIEHLQAELSDESGNNEKDNDARQVALDRMERLSLESQSLIDQLQTELESTNLSIDSLRTEVSQKEKQIKALDEKLRSADASVMTEYQSLNSDKQSALEEILGDIETWNQNNAPEDTLQKQITEISKLEQMLRESETCVQLLVQELETAEMDNNKLRKEVEQQTKAARSALSTSDSNSPIAQLEKTRSHNRTLLDQVSEIKDEMIHQVDSKALRNEYNKKSLELDRLQLAYSDLERKYLGTLRQ